MALKKTKTKVKKVLKNFPAYKIFGLGIIIMTLPALLTQTPFSLFDFSSAGQIGDTIGGITAPFIGLLSAYLIYKAFKVQVDANKIQSKNNEFSIALKLIDDLEKRLTQRVHRYEVTVSDGKTSKIEDANLYEIIRFWSAMIVYRNSYTGLIAITIRQVNYFKEFVEHSTNFSANDKTLLMEKAALTFGTELYNAINTLITVTDEDMLNDKESTFFKMCGKFHATTLQDFLYHIVDIDDFN
jgi:hypothetical protein